jgi:hypothetical protein
VVFDQRRFLDEVVSLKTLIIIHLRVCDFTEHLINILIRSVNHMGDRASDHADPRALPCPQGSRIPFHQAEIK